MSCPSDVNTGFINLVGLISQQDLNTITVNSYPLSLAFKPKTTIPSLLGNRIDESTENTCTYRGQKFSLVDVQICSIVSKGYTLPGKTSQPVAELVLSFSANKDASALSGILLCIPIYDSGTPNHGEYLNQLVDSSCKHTRLKGYGPEDVMKYSNINTDTSLTSCINLCCDDKDCTSYLHFGAGGSTGMCLRYKGINNLQKILRSDNPYKQKEIDGTTSGTVDHTSTSSCSNTTDSGKNKAGTPNLETIFYGWKGDTTQTSIAYKTCFETFDTANNQMSRSLYIVIFPNGITLTSNGFQQLLLQMSLQDNKLPDYSIPASIRGGDSTLQSYKFNNEGNKVPTVISTDGNIYSTPVSVCTDDFKHRFEYFTLPPRSSSSASSLTNNWNSEQCPYYKTSQYKCMPLNQSKDLSGNLVVPGNKTLDTVLSERDQAQTNATTKDSSSHSLTTEQIEGIVAGVAGVAIAAIVCLKIGDWISKQA